MTDFSEMIDRLHKIEKAYQSAQATLLDISRYLGGRMFRSDGEELILSRCKESLDKMEAVK